MHLFDVVDLCLDDCLHVGDSAIFATGVLIVILLILTHVASTHLRILSNQLILELGKQVIVAHREVLN